MSIEIQNLVTRFSGDDRDLSKSFRKVEAQTQTHVERVNKTLRGIGRGVGGGEVSSSGSFLPGLSNISNIIQGIPQIGQLMGALISPIRSAAEEGIKFNAFLEASAIGLETFLKDGNKVKEFLASLQVLSEKTPFQFEGLVKSSQLMMALKFSADEVVPSLTAIGDAIASTGDFSQDKLEGVITALGQIRLKGKVQAEEMMQLTERGIDAWGLLARAIGKTTEQTMKLGSQGKLRGKEATQAIIAMMKQDFGGMMDRQSKTLLGRLSNVEDVYQRATGLATEGLTKNINESLGAALEKADMASTLASSLNSAITPVAGMITGAVKMTLGGGITSGLTEGINAGQDMVKKAILTLGMDSVISPFKNLLDIHSPSGVFYDYGLACGVGFNLGFQDGLKDKTAQEGKKKKQIQQPEKGRLIEQAAAILGINPAYLAGIMQFESGFSTTRTNASGHKGLIQFGKDERKTYDVDKRTDFADQLFNAVVPYFQDRFKEVGLQTQNATLEQLYAAVLTGSPVGYEGKKDSNNTTVLGGVQTILTRDIPLVMDKYFGGYMSDPRGNGSTTPRPTLQPDSFSSLNFILGKEKIEDPVLKALFEMRQSVLQEQSDKAKEFNEKRKQINLESRNKPEELIKQLQELKANYDSYISASTQKLATIDEQIRLNYAALKQKKPEPTMTIPELPVPEEVNLPFSDNSNLLMPLTAMPKLPIENLNRMIDTTKLIGEAALEANKKINELGDGEWDKLVIQKTQGIKEKFDELKNSLPDLRTQLDDTFLGSMDEISGVLANDLVDWREGIGGMLKSIGLDVADVMRQIAAELVKLMLMQLMMKAIGGLFGGLLGGGGSLPMGNTGSLPMPLTTIPGFASGGRPSLGGWSVVGERGWELFKPDTAGRVFSHSDSLAILNSASGGGMSETNNSRTQNDNRVYNLNVVMPSQGNTSKMPGMSDRQTMNRLADAIFEKARKH